MIAELMNQHKKGIKGSCEEGLYISEDLFRFRKLSLYEDSFSIYLPLRFQEKTESEQEKLFGYSPFDYFYYYDYKDMSISFTHFPKDLDYDVNCLMHTAKDTFERLNPDMDCMDIIEWNHGEVDFVEMETTRTTRYDKKYQYFCMFAIGDHVYQILYDASARYMYPWRDVIHEILKTVKIVGRES